MMKCAVAVIILMTECFVMDVVGILILVALILLRLDIGDLVAIGRHHGDVHSAKYLGPKASLQRLFVLRARIDDFEDKLSKIDEQATEIQKLHNHLEKVTQDIAIAQASERLRRAVGKIK
ncbi:hypothetical protein ACJJTC_015509 [Scirpophaga incertulas]